MPFSHNYDALEIEKKWQRLWFEKKSYGFDPKKEGPIYSIDTPPPTVSGNLHIGHVFSYTQAEILIRHRRMKGFNIFYPFGFDDNGLPTERYVEKTHSVRAGNLKRDEFIKLCLETTKKVEEQFKEMWSSLGFSCDWELDYSTIDDRCQRISQRSFIDLYKKGRIYQKKSAGMWCPECNTAIAQAELDNQEKSSKFSDIPFALIGGGEIIISTTRPELLPACIAIFVHPEDEKNKSLIGKIAQVPLFGHQVPVIADEKADPEKGTGCVMCCTFGDRTDIEWWEKHGLEERIIIEKYGKLNELAGPYAGMKIKKAREEILATLSEKGLLLSSKDIVHPVNTHERCGTDVEYLITDQWYISVMDIKKELIEAGDRIKWYPSYMKNRFNHWVENLAWDWCISRQRFYGVPFPLWHCEECGRIILAEEEQLPVDPLYHKPLKPCECGSNSFRGEKDIMDTWATSSITPQINQKWGEKDSRENILRPMSLRPQAHDIIRTWAFYTITKALLHHDDIPWQDIVISGHVLFKKGQKLSKSKGAGSPEAMIAEYGADAIRYWTAQAKLGTDCYLEEKEFKTAKRLLTKLWNAAKLIAPHIKDHNDINITRNIDKALVNSFDESAKKADSYLENYEFSLALNEIETFFWSDFCDNYLEIVKDRLYAQDGFEPSAIISAKSTLKQVFLGIIKLFAPYIPHITEELYSIIYAESPDDSIHHKPYPKGAIGDDELAKKWKWCQDLLAAVRKYKTTEKLGHSVQLTEIIAKKPDFPILPDMVQDLKGAMKTASFSVIDSLEDLPQNFIKSDYGMAEVGIKA